MPREDTGVQEIIPDIFTWPWFSERHGYNFNGYLIRHPTGNIAVDPVEPDADALEQIVSGGLAHIVLTNRNHVRAANLLRARSGARVAIHSDDAAYARQQGAQLDDLVDIGTTLGPFTIVAAAGKSAGEIALYWPQRHLLLVGDAIVGNPPGHCALLPEKVIDNIATLRRSIAALLDLDFDTLLVGDGTPILSGAKAAVQGLVATFPS